MKRGMLETTTTRRSKKAPRGDVRPAVPSTPDLTTALLMLRHDVVSEGQATYDEWRPKLKRALARPGALNMAHYLALRKRDLRPFQEALAPWGLSSLGRSEARVLANLDAVLASVAHLTGRTDLALPVRPRAAAFSLGERLLARNARLLFGPSPEGRETHIMVTLPEQAATEPALLEVLVARGMSCARINCAHGTHADWAAMVRLVRAAEKKLGRRCRVLMDLCGPRARTGAVLSREDRRLLVGDTLLLRRGKPDPLASEHPFQAQGLPGEIFDNLQVGTTLTIDEGRVRARVDAVSPLGASARVTHAPAGGMKLKPDKGLNFPGTPLGLSSLTDKDRADLDVVLEHADLIGYSFVQQASDVEALWDEIGARLAATKRRPPGLILKIETEQAVHNLPTLIVAAAGRAPVGVMIARGDLAVEVGFQRLAELQEEILWLAEAAHTPVIWATQVLDSFVKKGRPSRAEMSDVVLAQRAECVMLNKGEFLPEALSIVDDIFRRMQDHQHKKTPRLRALHAWA
jgi:pyruvate kinase